MFTYGTQDGHLDFHTAPELWLQRHTRVKGCRREIDIGVGISGVPGYVNASLPVVKEMSVLSFRSSQRCKTAFKGKKVMTLCLSLIHI